MLELNQLYNMDCMEGMKQFPDKYFDLAIVDPPYGGGWEDKKRSRFGSWFDKYEIKANRVGGGYAKKYGKKIEHWDIAPDESYFKELFRVSKNQIIWGGNYFKLPPTRGFVIWRKLTISESFSMAMCEYAWSSFNANAKYIELPPQGTTKEKRFHPTQKPVALYRWLLNNYAKSGDKILDTHAGSASSFVAAYEMSFDYIGFEIDKDYYDSACKRMEAVMAQTRLLIAVEQKNEQIQLNI